MNLDLKTREVVREPPKRRPGRIIPGFVAVLLLATASGTLAWVTNYQPLVYGANFAAPGATQVRTLGLGDEYQFRHEPGATFELHVHLRNTGPASVTIRDIERERHYYWRLRDVEIGADSPDKHGSTSDSFRSFAPFKLDPGEYAQLRLRYEFADCEGQGGGSAFRSFRVFYSAFGMAHTAAIELPSSIGLTNVSGDCGDAAFR